MPIRPILLCSAVVVVAALSAGPAMAADYTTTVQDVTVDRPAKEVWQKIGGFCDISKWMKISCVYSAGSGDVGTVRRLLDKFEEVMVGKTSHSYTYTMPTTTVMYHGTLDVEADGSKRSKIIYTTMWDQAAPDAKPGDRAEKLKTFGEALKSMKAFAEAK